VDHEQRTALNQDRHRDRAQSPIGLEGLEFIEQKCAPQSGLPALQQMMLNGRALRSHGAHPPRHGLPREARDARGLAHRDFCREQAKELVVNMGTPPSVVESERLTGETTTTSAARETRYDGTIALAPEVAATLESERLATVVRGTGRPRAESGQKGHATRSRRSGGMTLLVPAQSASSGIGQLPRGVGYSLTYSKSTPF
jgi:hypothetical protein